MHCRNMQRARTQPTPCAEFCTLHLHPTRVMMSQSPSSSTFGDDLPSLPKDPLRRSTGLLLLDLFVEFGRENVGLAAADRASEKQAGVALRWSSKRRRLT
jgi:hypothetical protein